MFFFEQRFWVQLMHRKLMYTHIIYTCVFIHPFILPPVILLNLNKIPFYFSNYKGLPSSILLLLFFKPLSSLVRCQDGSSSGGAPIDQRYLLKWSVPLSFVEALEFGSSEDIPDTTRYPTSHSGEKVVINTKPSMSACLLFAFQ